MDLIGWLFEGYEGYVLLCFIVLLVLCVITQPKSSVEKVRREPQWSLPLDKAPKGGIKHTIYTGLLDGKTPNQIIPSLNKIIKERGGQERSDSEWLDYSEFVKVQMKEEGKWRG